MNVTNKPVACLLSLLLLYPLAAISEPALVHPDARPDDRSGRSVALHGQTLFSGAPATPAPDNFLNDYKGRVYPFIFDGSSWTAQSTLSPPASTKQDHLGFSMDIDGNLAVVGAPNALNTVELMPGPFTTIELRIKSGAAYIYESDGTSWESVHRLSSDTDEFSADFGRSVAISNTTVAVGSPGADYYSEDGSNGVHIFSQTPSGDWSLEQYLPPPPGLGASFGHDVALHDDVLAVAVPGWRNFTGAVVIYRRTASSWIEEGVFFGEYLDHFGYAIAMQGNTLVIGAPGWETFTIPVVLVYDYDEERHDWNLSGEIAAPSGSPTIYTGFGQTLSIDNGLIAIGNNADGDVSEKFDSPPPTDFMGEIGASVYRQHPISEEWLLVSRLIADDPEYDSGFGVSLDVSGDCVAVGAFNRDGIAGENEGGAYVFCDIPTDFPLTIDPVDFDVICCEIPIDPGGPYRYGIRLLSSKSVESVPVYIRVSIEAPNGKVSTIEESELQLALEGKPLFVEGHAELGNHIEPGEYKLSVTVIKQSGNSQTRHQYFKVQ